MQTLKTGLKLEAWTVKAIKSAQSIVIRFDQGWTTLEVTDNKNQILQYPYRSLFDQFKGAWVMLYLEYSTDSTEKAIFSTLRKGDHLDFYPRTNGSENLRKVGLDKVELMMSVKRFRKGSNDLSSKHLFMLDDEILPPNSPGSSIKYGLYGKELCHVS